MGLGISRYMEGAGPGRARRRRYRIRLSSNFIILFHGIQNYY